MIAPLTIPELSCLLAVHELSEAGLRPTYSKIAAKMLTDWKTVAGRNVASLTRKGFLARDAGGILFDTGRAL